jgi:hypothetical protein
VQSNRILFNVTGLILKNKSKPVKPSDSTRIRIRKFATTSLLSGLMVPRIPTFDVVTDPKIHHDRPEDRMWRAVSRRRATSPASRLPEATW